MGYATFCLILTLQLSLLAQSTDALGGHAGRVGVSGVLFAAVGGYAYALLTVKLGLGPWSSVCLALWLTTSFGVALGALLLRLRGIDFLLGTLAVQMGFIELSNNTAFFGGPFGIRDVPEATLMSIPSPSVTESLWLLAPAAVISTMLLHLFVGRQGQLTRVIHWLRDDDVSARASGISPGKWHIMVFAVHSIVGGLAGISIVMTQGYIAPSTFGVWMSITVLTAVYVSGTGGHPLLLYLGAAAIVGIGEFLQTLASAPELVGPIQQIATNAILIAILIFMPRGFAGPVVMAGPSAKSLE